MISESSYWKDDLLKVAKRLTKRTSQTRWPERSLACLEKEIFISFYAIRKLIESKRLSDNVVALQIPVMQYPSTGKLTTFLNSHRVDRLYDFATGRSVTLKRRMKPIPSYPVWLSAFMLLGPFFMVSRAGFNNQHLAWGCQIAGACMVTFALFYLSKRLHEQVEEVASLGQLLNDQDDTSRALTPGR